MLEERQHNTLILDRIRSPEDLKTLSYEELERLAIEIRDFLLGSLSKTGGHLASNLGIVELTFAIHRSFDAAIDKIIWDVGHQAYVHKIITGRRDQFQDLRKIKGLSGFPKAKENKMDCFDTGHSSTSVSAAIGLASARDIKKESHHVVTVVGDGSMTGGMIFEALNNAGEQGKAVIVILNDNGISISPSVGGLSKYLERIKKNPLYVKEKSNLSLELNNFCSERPLKKQMSIPPIRCNVKYTSMFGDFFEELGFHYIGPIDGHDLNKLMEGLEHAKSIHGPVIVHVCTRKGKGYKYAEEKPSKYHGVSPFNIETGEPLIRNETGYSGVFGREIIRLGEIEPKLVVITAAMKEGTGINEFSQKYPNRFFDVGIAEQHAATFAAGLAAGGLKPVFAVYSTFLQRAYDQIIHDIARQKLNVVFAIDRAGIVGEDGETHQGIYDISYLRHIPNMSIMSPADYRELSEMLKYAVLMHEGPIAIRYPRGVGREKLMNSDSIIYPKSYIAREGKDLTIVALGKMVETVLNVAELLKIKGISAEVINARFVKPLDTITIFESVRKTGNLVTIEDNTIIGGFGEGILDALNSEGIVVNIKIIGFPDEFIEQGTIEQIFNKYKMNEKGIENSIFEFLNKSASLKI
ncbi:1-deoxy-D-xylulose-5-phosphate synthase [Ruminiclostridium sufflavum DSM 19573]|uniref:1-deoxy-D-xylulose-5-phosphate synthase n=1 Tax=Ruminiclostridium sufflavum DSM 19573 TaxID=1121337 RepID=A0A318XPJ5_9FIRM|nr:1-deoxy-D-xylulose-5-phosphate synthase [Ruminiclostridium sufflavum]PYG88012.1 1-deoxy-D-xylulose-5-phosphate synthase [Ruminiclostridium sufflavum DSM 19573]